MWPSQVVVIDPEKSSAPRPCDPSLTAPRAAWQRSGARLDVDASALHQKPDKKPDLAHDFTSDGEGGHGGRTAREKQYDRTVHEVADSRKDEQDAHRRVLDGPGTRSNHSKTIS
jgi:hypothetical protein